MAPYLAMWHSPQPQRLSFEGRSSTGRCAQSSSQQYGSMSDLPPLVLQQVVSMLDPASRLELRKVNKLCRHAVDCAWKLVCMPLDQMKHHGLDQMLAQFPSAGCLVVTAPQQAVSLSVLGRRRRCEQILAVLLDNTYQQPSSLSAFDLSHAISSVTSAIVQLLVEALPALQHLALPAVAGIGSSGQWEVLRLLGQLQQLQCCELDCTYFAVGRQSNRTQQQHRTNTERLDRSTTPDHQLPVQLQAQHQQPSSQSAAASDSKLQHASASQASAAPVAYGTPSRSNSHASTDPLHRQVGQLTISDSAVDLQTSCSELPANTQSKAAKATSAAQRALDPVLQICPLLPLQPQPCRPWGNLCNLSQLQQLQLSHPCHLQELFENLKCLTRLRHLGLVRVQRGYSSMLLDPGTAAAEGGSVCEHGLGQLSCLQSLTRLELGLDNHCGCGNNPSALQPMRLITPPHVSVNAHASTVATALLPLSASSPVSPTLTPISNSASVSSPNPAAGVAFSHHSCCWSHLTQLRVLVLSGGICLDMPLLAATADCAYLTELRASGLVLESDAPLEFKGLQELRVLTVTQRFCLGGHSAAALFPRLQKLSIRDDGNHCPDLSCLKYHTCLSSLAVEAPATGWQLSSLQLGYLVHLDTLRQLSLASKCCAGGHPGGGPVVSHSPIPLPVGLKSPGALRSMSGSLQPCSSSHWLPAATLTQVTSLTLAGPANDHTLSQLPSQFPGLVTLQLLGSYYASDWGLKRLCRAPHLATLLLEGCEHVTEYGLEVLLRGGSIKVLAVHGCGGVDERACQRIRRACRHSCTNLSWHGTDGLQHLHHLQHHHGKHTSGSSSSVNSSSAASGWGASSVASGDNSHHDLSFFDTDGQHCNFGSSNEASSSSIAAGSGRSVSSSRGTASQWGSGSEFLERCWRESLEHQTSAAPVAVLPSRDDSTILGNGDKCKFETSQLQNGEVRRGAKDTGVDSSPDYCYSSGMSAAVGSRCLATAVPVTQQHAAAMHAVASITAADLPTQADYQPHRNTAHLSNVRTATDLSRGNAVATANVAIARVASAPASAASGCSSIPAVSKDLYGRKLIYLSSSSNGAGAANSCSYHGGSSNSSSCASRGTQHSSLTGYAR